MKVRYDPEVDVLSILLSVAPVAGIKKCGRWGLSRPYAEGRDYDPLARRSRLSSMRTRVRDASASQVHRLRSALFSAVAVSVHPAALFPSRGSKRMSRRDPVASAKRSSVRIEGRVRPFSRRATAG